jgi:hypothetical protein
MSGATARKPWRTARIDPDLMCYKGPPLGIQRLGPQGFNRLCTRDALHEIVTKIVTNAILHRDYSIATDVQIRVFENRIEVESPDRLPGHVTTRKS